MKQTHNNKNTSSYMRNAGIAAVSGCLLVSMAIPGYAFARAGNMQPGNPSSQMSPNAQMTMPSQAPLGFSGNAGNMLPGAESQFGTQQPQTQMGQQTFSSSSSAGEVVSGTTTNSSVSLSADYDNASYITMSDTDNQVKITSAGTYIVSGSCADGNITVKKGTTGVVLVLKDLDLTSSTGAAISVNKEAEAKIIIFGNVTLTDNENPEDEDSADTEIADAYDGAAIKAKANSNVSIVGDGTLTVNGNAKNGIKAGDEASFVIDGPSINVSAVNDGINANYDLAILSGNVSITANDDAVHADRILTIGAEDTTGPTINVTSSTEGLEGTVINVYSGSLTIKSSDDAINAANADAAYEGELYYSFNQMGGVLELTSTSADGIDSNGNVNLIAGTATIKSVYNRGDAGIDYDGNLYISNNFNLTNNSGVTGSDGMPGGQNGQMGQMPGNQMNGQHGQQNQGNNENNSPTTTMPPTAFQDVDQIPSQQSPTQNTQPSQQAPNNQYQIIPSNNQYQGNSNMPSNSIQQAMPFQEQPGNQQAQNSDARPFDDDHVFGRIGNWFAQVPQRTPWMPDWMSSGLRDFGFWIGGFSR